MAKNAQLTVQQWGNSLAIRIPAAIARSAHFTIGTPIKLQVEDIGLSVQPTGKRRLSLDESLALFDPIKHGGEAMASGRIGKEIF